MAATHPQIPLADVRLTQDDLDAVAATLRSGWLSTGPATAALETAFAEYVGCNHAVAVSSCTAALHLAYLSAGVGPGDEVIMPSFTFVATASTVLSCGGTPVFADILGPHDLSLDPDDVAARITPRTKAVAVVHFAGYPAAVDRLAAICEERGLALIEDSAHGPGARLEGRHVGTWGHAGTFSFFSNKVLSIGEGGALTTDDEEVATRVRSLRSHAMSSGTWDRHSGRTDSYDVAGLGFNYRIDDVHSTLALSRLRHIDDEMVRRRELVRRYRRLLGSISGLGLPYTDEAVEASSGYVMPILVDDVERRDAFQQALRERHNVQTSIFYPAVHEFTAYRERFPDVSLPRTEHAARAEVTIPLYPHMTEDEQDRVVEAIAAEI
jgi:dTDP-4-amino-4,6-dideoxygalactose transaminase